MTSDQKKKLGLGKATDYTYLTIVSEDIILVLWLYHDWFSHSHMQKDHILTTLDIFTLTFEKWMDRI